MTKSDESFTFRRPDHNDPRIDKRGTFHNWSVSILPYIPAHAHIEQGAPAAELGATWCATWTTPKGIWVLERRAPFGVGRPWVTKITGPALGLKIEGHDTLVDTIKMLLAFGAIERTEEDR